MDHFEYKTSVNLSDRTTKEAKLNELGAEGWQLVDVERHTPFTTTYTYGTFMRRRVPANDVGDSGMLGDGFND